MASPEEKKVALYVRTSTLLQDSKTQLHALREYAERHRLAVHDEYVDRGISGMKEKRPALGRLMRDAALRRFNVVMVFRFDRFARSAKQLLNALNDFQEMGIDFVSLQESVDTRTPMGKVVFTVMAGMAELERNIISERVRAGVARARSEGKQLGRPRNNNVNEPQVCEAIAEGRSIKAVAKQHGIARSTVRSIVARSKK